MRLSRVLLLLETLAALAQCAFYYPRTPPVVASHFDAAGRVNGWQSRPAFFAIYLFVVALMLLCFLVLPLTLRRMPPNLINLPHRDYYLAPERRPHTMAYLESYMEWMGVAALALMLIIIQLAIDANLNGSASLPPDKVWPAVAGFLIFELAWTARLLVRFSRPAG